MFVYSIMVLPEPLLSAGQQQIKQNIRLVNEQATVLRQQAPVYQKACAYPRVNDRYFTHNPDAQSLIAEVKCYKR